MNTFLFKIRLLLFLGLLAGITLLSDTTWAQQSNDLSEWPDGVREIHYVSPLDSTLQPALFYTPADTNKKLPLLVALHTWSGTYRQSWSSAYAKWCIGHNWAMVHPHFRGPNNRPESTGSKLVVSDILQAVQYTKRHSNIDTTRIYLVGSSGGGYTSLMMAGKAPGIWAGVSAWVPISDLRAWYHQSREMGSKYADEIANACGGAPGASKLVDQQYRRRSPINFLKNALKADLPIDLNVGIHDGHAGPVPVSNTLNAFNKLAAPADQLSRKHIDYITREESIPPTLKMEVADTLYGEKKVLFRRSSGAVRLTIFDGGHEIIYRAALSWLARLSK